MSDRPCRRLVGRRAPAAVTLALAAVVAGCGGPERATDGHPSSAGGHGTTPIVVISIDTLRADRLPAYGWRAVETPAIDALRADGVLFTRAYSHVPLTLPSHVTMMTGQLPSRTGVRDNARYRLAGAYSPYLPTLLAANGYRTGAAVSSYALRAATGFGQGFELFDDRLDANDSMLLFAAERRGEHTLDAALPWLRSVAAEPFFLLLHLYEPHLPYTPPPAFAERYGATYEAEIAAVDAVVGRLVAALRELDLYDRSLVVLLSDHGEGFGEHHENGHGILIYREAIHVPLIVKLPGGELAGREVEAPVQLVDLAPTVLGVAGLPIPQTQVGRSLIDLARSPAPDEPPRTLYAETMYPRIHFGWSELVSAVEGPYQLIDGPVPELYDLVADPTQRTDLLEQERRRFRAMRERLEPLRAPFESPTLDEDDETRRQLAALGYLTASTSAGAPSLADPKTVLADLGPKMDAAYAAFHAGDFAAAVPAFRAVLEVQPQMPDIWESLGAALAQLGRHEEALGALEHAMTATGGAPQVTLLAARSLLALGRHDEALEHAALAKRWEPGLVAELELAIALERDDLDGALGALRQVEDKANPDLLRRLAVQLIGQGRARDAVDLLRPLLETNGGPPVWNALALALVESGQLDGAPALLERVLAGDPDNARALETRALLALHRQQPAAALSDLERVVAGDGGANAWNLLAVARFGTGDRDGAIEAWRRAVALDPTHFDALYNLAFTAAAAGRRDLARTTLQQYLAQAPPARFARELDQARALLRQLGEGP